MLSKESHPPAATKQADAVSYDDTADAFDTLTERYSADLAGHMIGMAKINASDQVLDVGTGTGLLAILASSRVPSGRVVGIDHSEGMLHRATQKAVARGMSNIAFQAMDAEALSFGNDEFDVILSAFVLRHLPDPLAAICEMRRVLKPGGRIVMAVGARPALLSPAGLMAAATFVRDSLLERAGRRAFAPSFLRGLMARNNMALATSQASHAHMEQVETMLKKARFGHIQKHWYRQQYILTADMFWDVQSIFDSAARSVVSELSTDDTERLKQLFLERASEITSRGGKLIYRTGVYIYSAAC